MSFSDTIKKGATKHSWYALDIINPSGGDDLKASTPGMETEEFGVYFPDIISISNITRKLDIYGEDFGMAPVSILLNSQGPDVAAIFTAFNKFRFCDAILYVVTEDYEGNFFREAIYSGQTWSQTGSSATNFSLEIRSSIFSKLGSYQNSVTRSNFTHAPEREMDKGLLIPIGSPFPESHTQGIAYAPMVHEDKLRIATVQSRQETYLPYPGATSYASCFDEAIHFTGSEFSISFGMTYKGSEGMMWGRQVFGTALGIYARFNSFGQIYMWFGEGLPYNAAVTTTWVATNEKKYDMKYTFKNGTLKIYINHVLICTASGSSGTGCSVSGLIPGIISLHTDPFNPVSPLYVCASNDPAGGVSDFLECDFYYIAISDSESDHSMRHLPKECLAFWPAWMPNFLFGIRSFDFSGNGNALGNFLTSDQTYVNDAVYRLRGDVWTELTGAALAAQGEKEDSRENFFRFADIASGSYTDGDQLYCVPTGWVDPLTKTGNFINAAEAILKTMLAYSTLTSDDFDLETWHDAALEIASRNYGMEEFGYLLPITPGGQISSGSDTKDVWKYIAEMARAVNYNLILTLNGKLAIVRCEPWIVGTSTLDIIEENGDFARNSDPNMIFNDRPEVFNCQRIQFSNDQLGNHSHIQVRNIECQTLLNTVRNTFLANGIWGANLAEDFSQRRLYFHSYFLDRVEFTIPGLWGLDIKLGDYINITHGSVIGNWEEKQIVVNTVSLNPNTNMVFIQGWVVDANIPILSTIDDSDYYIEFNGINEMLYTDRFQLDFDSDFTIRIKFRYPNALPIGATSTVMALWDKGKNQKVIQINELAAGNMQLALADTNRVNALAVSQAGRPNVVGVIADWVFSWNATAKVFSIYKDGSNAYAAKNIGSGWLGLPRGEWKGMVGGQFDVSSDSGEEIEIMLFEWVPIYYAAGGIVPLYSWSFKSKSRADDLEGFTLSDFNIDDTNFIKE